MELNEWIVISALIIIAMVIIGLILAVILLKQKKEVRFRESNYQVFFVLGIMWMPIGIVLTIIYDYIIACLLTTYIKIKK